MKLYQISYEHFGKNYGWLLRLQFGYTVIRILQLNWKLQGPSLGFWAPAEYFGPVRFGFYGNLLPSLLIPFNQYPKL